MYTIQAQAEWPYFVQLVVDKSLPVWYTICFEDGTWPEKAEIEAVTKCLTLNEKALSDSNTSFVNFMRGPELKDLQTGMSNNSSMMAIFVQNPDGRKIMVCPPLTPLPENWKNTYINDVTYRTNATRPWPQGTKIVNFILVPLPPVQKPIKNPAQLLPSIYSARTQPQPLQRPSPQLVAHPPADRQLIAKPPPPRQFGAPRPVAPRAPQALAAAYVNGVYIKVINSDIVKFITTEGVEAVVNAANSQSFTPGDGGISGALRDAMYIKKVYEKCVLLKNEKDPSVYKTTLEGQIDIAKRHCEWEVCGTKKYLTPSVNAISECKYISETKAAWEFAKGYLDDSGVKFVIHAVGPKWTDTKNSFSQCASKLHTTIENTLALAQLLQVKSIAFPVISGGLFCHDDYPLKGREQDKAQELLLQVIQEHVEKMDKTSKLKNIFIVELDENISKQMATTVTSIDSGQRDTLMAMRGLVGP
jgi:O-acetyl-ADP-ribose deacetylase (regulator of RNase III)